MCILYKMPIFVFNKTREMLRYIYLTIFIFNSLLAFSTDTLVMEKLNHDAEVLFEKGDYESASNIYRDINVIADSLFRDINSTQIEDLRRTYFIDDLSLEKEKERLELLLLLKWTVGFIIIILLIGVFYLRWKRKNLLLAQSIMKKSQCKAEKSIKNKSLFLSNMSHEIRTPLNALIGFSSILIEDDIDDSVRDQCNSIIKYNGHLLLNLINDVVDVACLDIEKMTFNMKCHDVVEICSRIIETLNGIKQTSAEMRFISSVDELFIMTDDVRLQQLLINILINATKYTKEGYIELNLTLDNDNQAIFTITDTGSGITPEKQLKVFDRFETLESNVSGTGIGLSLCKLIICKMGGDIWIDSTYTSGARFVFSHPINNSNI